MAKGTTIVLYNSQTAGAIPLSANLSVGELAVNTADLKIYAKVANTGATSDISVISYGLDPIVAAIALG